MSSDLSIFLLGWDRDDITTVGNALLGRKAFIEEKKVTQSYSVQIQDKRNLHVTAPMGGQFVPKSDGRRWLRDEIVKDIKSRDYSALVFTMEIYRKLELMSNSVWDVVQQDDCLIDLIRNKGVIVIYETDTFKQEQNEKKISVTFSQWMTQQGGEARKVVDLVEGRCLLFDTCGDQDVLVAQRNELIDMIDERALRWKRYTDLKFEKTKQKLTQLEQQISDLNQRITLKTSEPKQQDKTNFFELEKMIQLLENNLQEISTEVKEHIQEFSKQLATNLNEATTKSEDTGRKLLELQENFNRENTERSLALKEMRDRLVDTEQQLSEYKKNFDRENAERTIALNEVRERSVETDEKLLELPENFDRENAERTLAIDEERKKLGATRNLLSDLQKKVSEKRGSDEALYQQVETNSREIIKLRDDTEKYISDLKQQTLKKLKEEEGASKKDFKDVQKSSVWEQIKSLNQSVPNLTSPWKMSLLLLVVLVPILLFLAPFPLPGLSANTKEITFLDESQDLRRYIDAKFEHMTKKIQAMETQLTHNKILDQMVKDKISKKHKTDSEIADRESQSVVKLFTELKEQLVNERSEKMESMSKTIPRSSIIWGMIQSLPMSLPLVLSWTLLLLLIVPVRVPIPWGHVLAALLVSLLILQLILILLLLGM